MAGRLLLDRDGGRKALDGFDIRVVNVSLGGDHPSTGKLTMLDELAEEAVAQGLVVVTAAGNGGQHRIVPPASAPAAITVGGVNDQNVLDPRFRRRWPSNYGFGAHKVAKPEVLAPSIWLAAPMLPRTWVHNEALFLWELERSSDRELSGFLQTEYAETRFKKETRRLPLDEVRRIIRGRMNEQKYIHPHYQHVDGTSMAAPVVSAVAAQMLEANLALTPSQVKEILVQTAEPLDGVPFAQQGAGVINAGAAVALALRARGGLFEELPLSPRLTRKSVTFYYHDPSARSVALVGGFNGWQSKKYHLHGPAHGMWQITIPRPPAGFLRPGHGGAGVVHITRIDRRAGVASIVSTPQVSWGERRVWRGSGPARARRRLSAARGRPARVA